MSNNYNKKSLLDKGLPHVEFEYVDVAFGSPHSRNHVIKLSNLYAELEKWKSQNGDEDCYCTYPLFPLEFKEYVENNKTVKGYKGPCYADYLPIDIDIDSENLQEAHERVKALLLHLEYKYELDLKIVRIYFSGAKGFHVEIPSEAFGFEPSPELHRVFRVIAEKITPDGLKIDTSIYDKMRLWRIPNTKNSKSGLYKIRLALEDVHNRSIDQIRKMASMPRRREFNDPNVELNPKLHALYQTALKYISTSRNNTIDGKKKYQDIFAGTIKVGTRHTTLTSFTGHLKNKGVRIELAKVIIKSINATKCEEPLEDSEVEGIVESVYSYESADEIKFAPIRVKDFMGTEEPELEWTIEGLVARGAVVLAVGRPKVGKSILGLNMGLCVAQGKSFLGRTTRQGRILYLALEDRPRLVKTRLWKMLKSPKDLALDVHCGAISLDSENFRVTLKDKVKNEKYVLVILDCLIESYRNADENSSNSMALVIGWIREIAQECDCAVVVIHHTRKSQGEGGDAIRGSSAIFGAVDGAIILKEISSKDFKRVSIEATLRDAESGERVVAKMDGDLQWEIDENYEEFTAKTVGDKIRDFLQDGPATTHQITLGIGEQYESVKTALRRLEERRQIKGKLNGSRKGGKVYSLEPLDKTIIEPLKKLNNRKEIDVGNDSIGSDINCEPNNGQGEPIKAQHPKYCTHDECDPMLQIRRRVDNNRVTVHRRGNLPKKIEGT